MRAWDGGQAEWTGRQHGGRAPICSLRRNRAVGGGEYYENMPVAGMRHRNKDVVVGLFGPTRPVSTGSTPGEAREIGLVSAWCVPVQPQPDIPIIAKRHRPATPPGRWGSAPVQVVTGCLGRRHGWS
jgi:hypothetical protein